MNSSIRSTSSLSMASSSQGRQAERPAGDGFLRPPQVGVAWWGGLLMGLLLPAFVSLGLWQWGKAADKLARQAELNVRSRMAPQAMPGEPAAATALRHRNFAVRGEYDAERQILVDNRVHAGRAGYQVVTPLKLEGSSMRVLVNRGWVPAAADRRILPDVPPPAGRIDITGIAVVPPENPFVLGPEATAADDETVWQHLGLQRFRQFAGYPLQPVVIQLDAAAPGGYVREWPRPDDRVEHHIGYALQWFGFAVTSLGIWLHLLLRRPAGP